MRHASLLAALAVVLASLACGEQTQATAKKNSYVTELALTQVAADLGPNAVVIRPVGPSDATDEGCAIDGISFNRCVVASDQPPELHVQTTLCELQPDEPSQSRYFVECRNSGFGIVPPKEIPHCPG